MKTFHPAFVQRTAPSPPNKLEGEGFAGRDAGGQRVELP